MIYFLFFVSFLFVFCSLIIAYHVQKNFSQPEREEDCLTDRKFSIVIAAKNEELNIPVLINSLKNLNYPEEKTEIIIADDNSSDSTYSLAKQMSAQYACIKILKANNKKLPGKKGVLDYGISNASNEYILITDADCIPEPDWIKKYSIKFSQGYDFLFGIAPFTTGVNTINKISCFENMRSSLITFAAASMGIPYSASARNFGFRKSSFILLNGYSKTGNTLSGDDDLLLREALKSKLKIGTVTFQGSKVFSRTKTNLGDYLKQKTRQTKTSFYYLPLHKILLSLWHLINIFFLLSPFFIVLNLIFVLLFLIKICFDLFLVLSFQKKFGYTFRSYQIIYLQVFYEFFLIINFLGALIGKDNWK